MLYSVDSYGDTKLHQAVLDKDIESVKQLLEQRLDVNTRNYKGKTPLHYAADMNSVEIATILISNKANVNVVDSYGNEPLWTAVFNALGDINEYEIVKLILLHGGRPGHKNNADVSPIDFAKEVGDSQLVTLLQEYMV